MIILAGSRIPSWNRSLERNYIKRSFKFCNNNGRPPPVHKSKAMQHTVIARIESFTRKVDASPFATDIGVNASLGLFSSVLCFYKLGLDKE